ncbi:PA domain-containing protein [Streptomyces sp. CB02115]|uniref:PA domain-containing protein n=1 Tax=Streptomyces sp. CB02115 TaxID=1703939 RepID=UPI00093E15FA|nr:PA domain-containing protein [Streptomyces sp. CB02115]OKJ46851.1 hypothetical protein AMK28_37365 [Streptomyces sp. CB02115]
MNIPEVLIGSVYEAVVVRSRGHCECDLREPGNCGLGPVKVHSTGQRCLERETHRSPLVAAPRDPEVSDRDAITLAADEVIVLCRGCYVRRRNRAEQARVARDQAALLAEENTLFPSDLLPPTGPTLTEQQRDVA